MVSFTVEASHYIKRLNPHTKISTLDRLDTVAFVDSLYKKGAISVEVYKKDTNVITELRVRVPNLIKVRNVLAEVLKTNPNALDEVQAGIFRVQWN